MLNRLRSAYSSFIRTREAALIGKRLDAILGSPDPNELERRASVQRRLHAEVMSALLDRRTATVDRRRSWSA